MPAATRAGNHPSSSSSAFACDGGNVALLVPMTHSAFSAALGCVRSILYVQPRTCVQNTVSRKSSRAQESLR
jgi:hypothetical protein